MKFIILIILSCFFIDMSGQELRNVKIYWNKVWNSKIYEAEIYERDNLIKKVKYDIAYNSKRTELYYIIYTEFDYFKHKKRLFGFSWGLSSNKNSFILQLYKKYENEKGQVNESVILNSNIESMQNISSVYSVSRANGYEKKYQPGEYYYDFPADPDSIFNTIPKELGLPDTLLHIKYKQPWME